MVVEVNDQDMGDGMQCINHPYTKNPGGICAFCLQEKLGKLVSSSFPLPKQVSSSSSSSPSFRSDSVGGSTSVAGNLSSGSLSLSLSVAKIANNNVNEGHYYNKDNGKATRLPFLLAKKKKKITGASSSGADRTAGIVFKRSKSTATPRTGYAENFSPRKRGGFWSFLHIPSSKHLTSTSNATKKPDRINERMNQTESGSSKEDKIGARTSQNENWSSNQEDRIGARSSQNENGSSSSSSSSSSISLSKKVGSNKNGISVIVEEDGSPNIVVTEAGNASRSSNIERKVSRSRSVGCGSRSFSGDFFERISNGFGDCTLRRVESQREGKTKVSSNNNQHVGSSSGMRDMVRCGGIFSGFMIMTSSSSSSSSSATWVSSTSADHHHHPNDVIGIKQGSFVHGSRNRSWGWAFASPMRALSSTSAAIKASASSAAKDGKRGRVITESNNKNTTPNLAATPSLLAVRS